MKNDITKDMNLHNMCCELSLTCKQDVDTSILKIDAKSQQQWAKASWYNLITHSNGIEIVVFMKWNLPLSSKDFKRLQQDAEVGAS